MELEARARFIQHRGRRIYLIDCEGLLPGEVLRLIPMAARDIRGEPLGSVLTLVHMKDLKLDARVNAKARELAEGNKPYVKAAAVAGLSSLHRVVHAMVKLLTRRPFELFDTLEEAKDYLASLP